MRAAICVPWRAGVPSREMVWRQIGPALAATGVPVYTADSAPGPFNRSEARNRAAEAVPEATVLAFMDADAYLPPDVLLAAIERAERRGRAIYPYTQLMSMNPLTGESRPRVNFTDSPILVSGNVIVPRALYERTGGWDERFTEYGWEDGAFMRMLRLVGKVEQMVGTLVCMEHSRTPAEQPDFSVTQRPAILDEYDAATTRFAGILLGERIAEYRRWNR